MKKTHRLKNEFPKGWDEQRVKHVIVHYDRQSQTDAVREYLTGAPRQRKRALV